MKIKTLVSSFLLLLLPLGIFAEDGGWWDKEYNFSQIERILIITTLPDDFAGIAAYDSLLVTFPDQLKQKLADKKIQALTYPEAQRNYRKLYNEALPPLQGFLDAAQPIRITNEEPPLEELFRQQQNTAPQNYLSQNFDTILVAYVTGAGSERYKTAGYMDWVPRVYYTSIVDKDGKIIGYDSHLTYDSYYVPPRSYQYRSLTVIYTLFDAKTGKELSRYAFRKTASLDFKTLGRKIAGSYASILEKKIKNKI